MISDPLTTTQDPSFASPVIVALDTEPSRAVEIARMLVGYVSWMKIGMRLFYLSGPDIVRTIKDLGFNVFVDVKLHDIPNTVRDGAASLARLGAGMITVHGIGGSKMIEAAKLGAIEGATSAGVEPPAILAVTVLTSSDQATLEQVGIASPVEDQVNRIATLAARSGADGVICSPREASSMGSILEKGSLIVTPGVRPQGFDVMDQARVTTPAQALQNGSTHLVIGRPIIESTDPVEMVKRIHLEIDEGLKRSRYE